MYDLKISYLPFLLSSLKEELLISCVRAWIFFYSTESGAREKFRKTTRMWISEPEIEEVGKKT